LSPNVNVHPKEFSARQILEEQMSNTQMTTLKLLNSGNVSIILTPKTLLTVNAVENVGTLLQRLRESELRCALVFDTQHLFIGFVDALDITTHVLDVTNWTKEFPEENFRELDWQGQRFISEHSGKLMNISFGNPFRTVTPETSLKELVEIMSSGVHRLAVVQDGVIINVVSQWDVLLLIASRISFMGYKFQETLNNANLAVNELGIYFVPEDLSTIETLKLLRDYQIGGVPLVDSTGRISANFSATDLFNLTLSNFPLLSLSTRDFLFRTQGFIKPPICCKKFDTIENVILKFLCFRVHRVYVIDKDFRPTGVVTLTDIMKYLLVPEDKDIAIPKMYSSP